ncbi:NmrA family NAD(P)-binding protein [Variovorax sp. MHTC-1]|uniref:NmrA family NAD(P)-binding protein n=1 Tax=Variovorax sp. MHTC-1 TaxID=2495593 RepID=UPI000F88E900|nr:NmrA family NAD(P)-binding protein [Variovorax sp. MHTC-1]RST53900.1 NAD-dependent epimerase/dehydratase family protein [Variovorax sp. MHTC-1]
MSNTNPAITVMGATGHTGGKIAARLQAAGAKVRALGRNPDKLAALERAGAEVLAGDTCDPAFLARAFRGADAVYTLLATDRRAPDYRARQDQEGEAIAEALRASGVRQVVALSSLGADVAEGTGVIAGLHAQEERLKRIAGIHLLLLRPVSFFENFYDALGQIKEAGVIADTVEADIAVPMIAADDIAAVAAGALLARDWTGVALRELLGQRDLSHSEVARILGERIGKPELAYVQISEAEMTGAMIEAGLSPSFAALYLEMTHAFNEGRIGPSAGRNAANTTATRFEDFAEEFARVYAAL